MQILKKLLISTLLLIILSGCCKINVNIKIDDDNKAIAKLYVLLNESNLKKEGKNIHDVITYLRDNNFQIIGYQPITEEIDGQNYIGFNCQMDTSFITISNNENILSIEINNPFKEFDINTDVINQSEDLSFLEKIGFEANINIKTNGPIIDYENSQKISSKELKCDLLGMEETVYIRAYTSDFAYYSTYIGKILSIILIIISIYFLIKRLSYKKKKTLD